MFRLIDYGGSSLVVWVRMFLLCSFRGEEGEEGSMGMEPLVQRRRGGDGNDHLSGRYSPGWL